MHTYKFKTFTTERGTYPTIYFGEDLAECYPDNPKALYTFMEEDFFDDDEREDIFAVLIPNRIALFELIKDLSDAISTEMRDYLEIGSAPNDDYTDCIYTAIDIVYDLKAFDNYGNR